MTTAYTASNNVPLVALPNINGLVQKFSASTTNPADATFAPDGLAPAPVFGLGGQQLQGNEIAAGGIATVVSYIGPLLNSGVLCWVLLDCEGGAQQVAPATKGQHAVQFQQLVGLVGSARNASMGVVTPSASATFTADEVILETTLGGLRYCVPHFNHSLNLSGTGIGGMDTGSAPSSGYVAIYAALNPVTGAAGIIAANATSAVAPSVYGGANLPAGYTATALISVWPTTAAGLLDVGQQVDRTIYRVSQAAFTSTSPVTSLTPATIASSIPPNAKVVSGDYQVTAANGVICQVIGSVRGSASGVGGSTASGFGQLQTGYEVPVITSQGIYYDFFISSGGGGVVLIINVTNYIF